jgi:hypothetical protein
MFFELNGKTYGVKFSRNGTSTYAELIRVDDAIGIDNTNITGQAHLFYKDRFEKSKGRKVALASLLNKVQEFYNENPKEYPDYNMTEEVRKMIWEIYFKTHRK